MRSAIPRTLSATILPLVVGAAVLPAQGRGDYFNVEAPQVAPLAIAQIAGHDYLLVCNTPANAVEIWDTDEAVVPAANRLLRRIPVGLEPVSVVWSAQQQRLYTADFLSDSVTSVIVTAPTGPSSLTCVVDAVRNVGDEPVHLALTTDASTLLVAFMTPDAIGAFDAVSLLPVAATAALPAPTERLDLTASGFSLNEPWRIAVRGSDVVVLGHKGGNDAVYDFDLFDVDLATGARGQVGGLGSTNTGMAFASNGDLYVVGGLARNDLIGGPSVAAAPTGFVESHLYVVTGFGTPTLSVQTRDLNLAGGVAVAPGEAISLPSDVVVYETAGQPTKLFIAGFGNDRIGVLVRNPLAPPSAWQMNRIAVPPVSGGSTASGPRGLVLKPQSATMRARLYSLNRLDNSVSIIDPTAETVLDAFALVDPTPAHVRIGRPFLYSGKLSASGFVSCASCHADGRLDGLAWNLGDVNGLATPFGRFFADGPTSTTATQLAGFVQNGFNPDKKLMVTQSLQGLLNGEVDPAAQDLVTNAPYHWRGDRASFTKFNEAFVNLMGLPDIGTPSEPKGLTDADMTAFEEFVGSIHYPPNPEQPTDRVFSGDFGTADQVDGSGAQLGLKLFHTVGIASIGDRACVQCHSLPEGSNNKFTVREGGGVPGAQQRQPIESAALRGLFQKQAVLERDALSIGTVVLATSGLLHAGVQQSINHFVTTGFAGQFNPTELQALQAFVREFDWGTAPMVGQLQAVANSAGSRVRARIASFETQARLANAGLCVRASLQSGQVGRGFRFDPIHGTYVEETAAGPQPGIGLAALLALATAPTDRLVFVSVPLGSERRVAAVVGPAAQPPVTPSALAFLPMTPDTAWARVPELHGNWIPVPSGGDFAWNSPNGLPTPLNLHAIRLFQHGLLQAGGFGLPALRHDAPRRFRVAGLGIQHGARLIVNTPDDPAAPVPNPAGPLGQMITRAISLPIHPTGQTTAGGAPIWETAVELDPRTYYRLMLGGPFAPGITSANTDFNSTIPEPPPPGFFDAATYNWHFVQVQNPGSAPTDLGWQRLTIG